MRTVDLNCDLGEGAGQDAALMPLISSANIACGAHAGDEATMRVTVRLAREHGVWVGAHPGYPDREHFGRRELPAGAAEIRGWVLSQTQRLLAIAEAEGMRVRHVKPHGALYNVAARDAAVARAVAEAVYEADPRLLLVGLAGSRLLEAGAECGLSTLSEVFVDRCYEPDGSLTPRQRPGALIEDEAAAVAQALRLIQAGQAIATDGSEVALQADTLCLHGDGPRAVPLAQAVHAALQAAGFRIRA